jgi:hypothetical protein
LALIVSGSPLIADSLGSASKNCFQS